MKGSKLAPVVVILVLAVVVFLLKNCNNEERAIVPKELKGTRGLDRNPHVINYSKHARCRMDCRSITESEIKSILAKGKINYTKSELQNTECKKRYAVEGIANRQHIRIIVAPCDEELTVITCIDLDKEWSCDCK